MKVNDNYTCRFHKETEIKKIKRINEKEIWKKEEILFKKIHIGKLECIQKGQQLKELKNYMIKIIDEMIMNIIII